MPDRFARRQLDDQEIWLDFQGGRFYGLNATATVILDAWQQGVRAPDALADRLIERFQVSRADACLAVDWTISIERGVPAQSDASIESTGDVRNEVGVWAAFGRLGDERIVSLRGVAELRAHPGERRAVVSHAGPASSDVAVLRRVSPYLATLLGRTALHAASVVLPAGAVLCCADAGTGKSTLARALDRAEFAVLGDDHVVLDVREGARIGAHPSFPFIDVHVGGSNGGSDGEDYPARIGPGGEGKTSVQLFSPRPTKPVPVVAVAFMTRGARDARVAREPIEPTDALARLLRDVVFVADPADEASQVARLDVCLALLKAAPAVRLEIPDGLDRMATTAAEVATLWSGHAT